MWIGKKILSLFLYITHFWEVGEGDKRAFDANILLTSSIKHAFMAGSRDKNLEMLRNPVRIYKNLPFAFGE